MINKEVPLAVVAAVNPRLPQPPDADEPVSFVSMSDIDAGEARVSGEEQRAFGDVSRGYTHFLRGDVLVAKITPCFENGKIARADIRRAIGVGSTEFHVVRADPNLVDPGFVLHYLRRTQIRREGELRMTGSAGQRRVPESFLRTLPIPLPSVEVQRQIVAVLDAVATLQRKQRAARRLAESLPGAIFREMFGAGDNSHSPREPISNLVDPKRPITYGILKPGPDEPGGVPYVRVVDIRDGWIDGTSVRRTSTEINAEYKRSILRTGDLVMSIRGHVGRLGQAPNELSGANITQDSARLAISTGDPRFVMEAIKSDEVQRWMKCRVKGVAVTGINLSDVRQIPVPVATMSQQRSFSQRAARCDRVVSQLDRSIARLAELYTALQHQAFRQEP